MAAVLDRDEYARRIIAIHFDPQSGAPYWLERRDALDFDPLTEIHGVDDLARLGPMNENALRERPLLDFVPLSRRQQLVGAVVTETGGATGPPKRTIFSRAEFRRAFVEPFVAVAQRAGFPRGALWLWLGPSGPHVIGQAAAACAAALDSPQPFSVDFDPRWFRKLPVDSLGRTRYMDHLLDQAMHVVNHESVEVIFSTPAVLARLAEKMNARQRERVRGVHYGGMRVAPDVLRAAQGEWFPAAIHLAGYGNSLFGVCMEFGGAPDRPLRYYPHGPRHVIRVADDGRVWMSRLDETVLIANLAERDIADSTPSPLDGALGFGPGVEDPRPATTNVSASVGIY